MGKGKGQRREEKYKEKRKKEKIKKEKSKKEGKEKGRKGKERRKGKKEKKKKEQKNPPKHLHKLELEPATEICRVGWRDRCIAVGREAERIL